MTEQRVWETIEVRFNDGSRVYLRRDSFDKLEEIKDVLNALVHVKSLQADLDRLLGRSGL